jgi:endonuclease/exonuclease/phosphatase (EEP) superfamily protein YafD
MQPTASTRRAITAVIALFGALTLLGLLEGAVPYLELTTFFRPQYAFILAAASFAALVLRLFPLARVALLLAAVNLLVITSSQPTRPVAGVESHQLRLLVVNVQYNNRDYDRVARLIHAVRPDVVGVTELTPAWVAGLENALGGFGRRLAPEEGAYGIGLYSKLPITQALITRLPADGPPSIVATVSVGRNRVDLLLTHVHTPFAGSIHQRQLAALADARERLGDHIAVCGDFNAVPWSHAVRKLASTAQLQSTHPRYGINGTWPAGIPLLRLPIDNCLISEGLTLLDREVGPDVGSDHLPLIIRLAIDRPGSTARASRSRSSSASRSATARR